MWELEAFDKQSGWLDQQYKLDGLDTKTLVDLLNIDETEYPAEVGGNPVSIEQLPLFDRYLRERVVPNPDHNYYVTMFAD